MKKGIDVSYAQGRIDWARVKKAGVEFAVIRAGFGKKLSQKDKYFEENIKGALAVGVEAGAYWFSYAVSVEAAKQEAAVCNEVLAPYKDKLTYPVCFDYEYDSIRYSKEQGVTPTKKSMTDIAVAFLEAMKGYGYQVANYTNIDFIKNRWDNDRLKPYDLWLAHYTDGAPAYPCALHQTSSGGKIDGIKGNVDLDAAYKDYSIKKPPQNNNVQSNPPAATCTGSGVRLRSEAHTAGKILGFVNKGDKLTLLCDDGWGWSKVKAGDKTGWMVNEYIKGAERSGYKTGKCGGTAVNFRAAANLQGNILGQLNRGDTFTLISILPSNWLHVRWKGKEGYVFYDKSYISL